MKKSILQGIADQSKAYLSLFFRRKICLKDYKKIKDIRSLIKIFFEFYLSLIKSIHFTECVPLAYILRINSPQFMDDC